MLNHSPAGALNQILNLRQVQAAVGYSPSQIYRLIAKQSFPDRVRLGPGRVGWRTSDIAKWLDSRPTAGSDSNSRIGETRNDQ
jgi:prophage regulatory protein